MKLQDLLRHIADNVENGKDWCDGLVSDKPWSMKEDVMTNYHTFELAPRTHDVNGFTVPAPEVKKPDGGYFYPKLEDDEYYWDADWDSHELDELRLERGLIHLTKEAAIANAKAMLGIDPNKD